MAIRTVEKDRGYNEFMRELKKIKRQPIVKVGFQEEKGNALHPGGSMGTKPLTVVQVATFNEFGTEDADGNLHVPERSFIRSTMDEKRRELLKVNKKLYRQIAEGTMSTERALKILGIKIKALIQKKITDLRKPANAPSTIRRKRSSNPLIDTGLMRQSVTYKVDMDGRKAKTA